MPAKKTNSLFTTEDKPTPKSENIKEFVDPSTAMKKVLMERLPYVRNAVPKISLVYTAKQEPITKYRVNYIKNVDHQDSFVMTQAIVESMYFVVQKLEDGSFTVTRIKG